MAEITGQCLCGQVTLTVTNPVGWLGVCHCNLCQRWSGGLWAGFPAPEQNVQVDGPVTRYPSSELAERAFCSACGTQLWMRNRDAGAEYDLMPGLFEAARDWPLKSEIYHDQALRAFALKGDHPRASSETYRQKNPEVNGVEG